MPPDPILALMCFVGLLLYILIGCVVITLILLAWKADKHIQSIKTGNTVVYTDHNNIEHKVDGSWNTFWFVLGWPLVILAHILLGVLFLVFYVPFLLGSSVFRYLVNTVSKVPEEVEA